MKVAEKIFDQEIIEQKLYQSKVVLDLSNFDFVKDSHVRSSLSKLLRIERIREVKLFKWIMQGLTTTTVDSANYSISGKDVIAVLLKSVVMRHWKYKKFGSFDAEHWQR